MVVMFSLNVHECVLYNFIHQLIFFLLDLYLMIVLKYVSFFGHRSLYCSFQAYCITQAPVYL
uniref:Uncharacterized protein n=1 Tax=Rhizophora mucronata TaxID=61149 RepID=A0A2P2M3X4_RHIMU